MSENKITPNAIIKWMKERARRREMLKGYLDQIEAAWGLYGARQAIETAFWLRGPSPSRPVLHNYDLVVWVNEAVEHCRYGRLPHLPLDDCIEATL